MDESKSSEFNMPSFFKELIVALPSSAIASAASAGVFVIVAYILTEFFGEYDFVFSQSVSIIMVLTFGIGFVFALIFGALYGIFIAPLWVVIIRFGRNKNDKAKLIINLIGGIIIGLLSFGIIPFFLQISFNKAIAEIVIYGLISGIVGITFMTYIYGKQTEQYTNIKLKKE